MRISRSRVVARVALLAAASLYLGWQAWAARAAGSPLALGWGLMAVLALLAAGAAALALRRRPARRTLRLQDLATPSGREPRPGSPGSDAHTRGDPP